MKDTIIALIAVSILVLVYELNDYLTGKLVKAAQLGALGL